MKKIVELFKYGIGMYANSLYGDINCKYKEDLNKDSYRGKKKQRKKSVESSSHLRVIK